MKNVVVLGSTGSIGTQALEVLGAHSDKFRLLGISAGSNAEMLARQAKAFRPKYIALADPAGAEELKGLGAEILIGADAAPRLASMEDADLVVHGISGISGLVPLLSALESGKTVALANKEGIVCAHRLVQEAIERGGGKILPVDSEQSAIFQCLCMGNRADVKRLMLTASGGPFRETDKEALKRVTAAEALKHPVWNMGGKITIDSATLFNKGLEIMEASFLFGIPGEKIDVLIHPQSIVHSMVEFVDGSVAAQLSMPDMRLAIQYALTYPERRECRIDRLDLARVGALSFFEPDFERFPALSLAYAALKEGEVLPIAYNGANEAAVNLFMNEKIGFCDISSCVEYAMGHIDCKEPRSIEDVIGIDRESRRLANSFFRK
ncbi:MAG: 1-deoxy-D-xylulose-5-phosphate reductoisomerase [Bacillota bacterium]